MQSLRDAAILLGLVIVLSSVRIARIDPGPAVLELVPPAHAAVPAAAIGEPGSAGEAAAPTPADTVAPVPEAVERCTTNLLRVKAVEIDAIDLGNGVLAVRVNTGNAGSQAPRACRLG